MKSLITKGTLISLTDSIGIALGNIKIALGGDPLRSYEDYPSGIRSKLKTADDIKLFEDTVHYLKNNRNEKSKKITFSDDHSITVSIY